MDEMDEMNEMDEMKERKEMKEMDEMNEMNEKEERIKITDTESMEGVKGEVMAYSWFERQEKRSFRFLGMIGYGLMMAGLLIMLLVSSNTEVTNGLLIATVILGELLAGASAFLPILLGRCRIKEVFHIDRLRLRQVVSLLFFWLGFMLCNIGISGVVRYYFPEAYTTTITQSYETFARLPMWIALLSIVPLAGIFEELLFRGLITYSLGNRMKKWSVIVIVGLMFGAMHLTPVNLVGLSLLGGILTYIMLETGNILLPILLHMFNNLISGFTIYATLSQVKAASGIDNISSLVQGYVSVSQTVGSIVIGMVGILVLVLAVYLLHEGKEIAGTGYGRRLLHIGASLFVILAVVTGLFIVTGNGSTNVIMDTHFTKEVNIDSSDISMEFTIEASGVYYFDYSLINDRGIIGFTLTDEEGNIISEFSGCSMTITGASNTLEAGKYDINMHFMLDPEEILSYWGANNIDFNEVELEKLKVIDTDLSVVRPVEIGIKVHR